MSKITTFALAGIATLFLLGARTRAETPAADAKSDKPAATAEVKPAQPAAVAAPLTDEGLGTLLANMGYDAKIEKLKKTVIYTVKIDQGSWTYYIDLALSNDKDQLWITSAVADFPADGKVPAETLLQLLAETDNIGPAAVYYDKQFKKIKVAMPLLNRGGVTPAIFRTYLNDYMKDVVEVQKLCDFPKPADKAEVKTETKTEAAK